MTTQAERLKALIQPTVEALGHTLWGIVYQSQGNQAVLKIFIENPTGVKIEDCEKVSRQISSVLDTEDLLRHRYTLEVSSPGIDRLLFEAAHYEAYLQKEIKVKVFEPINGRRSFTGVLESITKEGKITLLVEGTSYSFSLAQVQTAQVVF